MEILWISLIPTAIALIAAFGLKLDISLKELAIQIVGGFLVLGAVWVIGLNLSSLDKEVWNGRVIDKTVWKFSCHTNTSNPCTNGYSCHFHEVCSGSRKNKSCHTEHDTCYVYPWEQNWYVKSDLNSKQKIDRIDAQGALQPPRWVHSMRVKPIPR